MSDRARWGLAVLVWLLGWEAAVHVWAVNPFVLPAPTAVMGALIAQWPTLVPALWMTVKITWVALALAVITGVVLAFVMHRSRWARAGLQPLTIILQVTPIVAIAPLVLVWSGIDAPMRALVIIAWIVALFPVLSAVQSGLKSIDPALHDLFSLYGASGWQRVVRLEAPACLPALMSGLKVAAGLALIGAIVGEFAAGSGQSQGLAWRLLEAQYRLDVPTMFACLVLLASIGVAHFTAIDAAERYVLAKRGLQRASGPL